MKCTIMSCEVSINVVSMELEDLELVKTYRMTINVDSQNDIEKIKVIYKSELPINICHIGNSVIMLDNKELDFHAAPDPTNEVLSRPFEVRDEIINELSCDDDFDKMFNDERITERLYMILHTYKMSHVMCYEVLVCYIGFKYLSKEHDLQSIENECFENKTIPEKYSRLMPKWVTPYMFVKACKLMAMKQMLSGEMFARMSPSIPTMNRRTSTEYVRYVDTKLNNDEIAYMKRIFLEKLH